jgi:ABC-type enterobactin transport system permease subunit
MERQCGRVDTFSLVQALPKSLIGHGPRRGPVLAICMFERIKEMQMAITFMAVVAGMIFSLAVALLAEELIFGQVFRLLFARRGQQ